MPLYRLRRPLDLPDGQVLARWQVTELAWLKPQHIDILLERGAITLAQAPSIAQLGYMFPKQWRGRAARLQQVGIEDIHQLFDVSETDLATDIGFDVQTIKRWKCELKDMLHVEVPSICI